MEGFGAGWRSLGQPRERVRHVRREIRVARRSEGASVACGAGRARREPRRRVARGRDGGSRGAALL